MGLAKVHLANIDGSHFEMYLKVMHVGSEFGNLDTMGEERGFGMWMRSTGRLLI